MPRCAFGQMPSSSLNTGAGFRGRRGSQNCEELLSGPGIKHGEEEGKKIKEAGLWGFGISLPKDKIFNAATGSQSSKTGL